MEGGGRGGRSFPRPAPYDRNDRFSAGGRYGPRGGRPGLPGGLGRGGGGGVNSSYGYGGGRGGQFRRGGGNGGHCVHMRGLPFKASPQDIAYFFKPIRPINIDILYDSTGRPSGEADIVFECHEDAMRAMRRDKNNMEHRYIELFLNSSPGLGGGGLGGGGLGGGGLGSGGLGSGGLGGGFKPNNRNFRN